MEVIGLIKALGGGAGIVALITAIIQAKKTYKKRKQQKIEVKTIEVIKARGEIRRMLEKLLNDFDLTFAHVLRFHNGGLAMKPINSKLKLTIEYERVKQFEDNERIPKSHHPVKSQWQGRTIDVMMEYFLEAITIDKNYHVKDIEEYPESQGLRLVYNEFAGKELYFVELGMIGFDYLVLAVQRETKTQSLTAKNRNLIEYYINSHAEQIFKIIKNRM